MAEGKKQSHKQQKSRRGFGKELRLLCFLPDRKAPALQPRPAFPLIKAL
ncbi:hypothetical protein CLOM621_07911 [Clostridium sp. M62/1]|nr:hypothetical protein CLOM621_07911 [Clostridium sp. M62/1]